MLSEIIASMDAFASPSLQGDGLPDRTRQGVFPARESYGKYPPLVLDCIRREMVNGAVDVLDASQLNRADVVSTRIQNRMWNHSCEANQPNSQRKQDQDMNLSPPVIARGFGGRMHSGSSPTAS